MHLAGLPAPAGSALRVTVVSAIAGEKKHNVTVVRYFSQKLQSAKAGK